MNDTTETTETAAAEVKQPNKNDLKKHVRDIVDSITAEGDEVPLFRDRVGTEVPEGETLMKGFVVLHNRMEEPVVQRLLQAAGDSFIVYCEEWTAESKRGKWEQKKSGAPRTRTVSGTYKGATITPTYKNSEGVLANPRKDGTAGHIAYNILLAHFNEHQTGMKYEDYIKAGGRSDHVRWDHGHNYIEVSGVAAPEAQSEAA